MSVKVKIDRDVLESVPSNWTWKPEKGIFDTDPFGVWSDAEEEHLRSNLAQLYDPVGIVDKGRRTLSEIARWKGRGENVDGLGGRIMWRVVRETEGLSRQELADLLGMDRASISRYESGARWPDGNDYLYWLETADERQKDKQAEHCFWMMSKRDGWMRAMQEGRFPSVKDGGPSLGITWELFNERIVEPWLEAGMEGPLGHFTPDDYEAAADHGPDVEGGS